MVVHLAGATGANVSATDFAGATGATRVPKVARRDGGAAFFWFGRKRLLAFFRGVCEVVVQGGGGVPVRLQLRPVDAEDDGGPAFLCSISSPLSGSKGETTMRSKKTNSIRGCDTTGTT